MTSESFHQSTFNGRGIILHLLEGSSVEGFVSVFKKKHSLPSGYRFTYLLCKILASQDLLKILPFHRTHSNSGTWRPKPGPGTEETPDPGGFNVIHWGSIFVPENNTPNYGITPLQYSCLENPMDGGAW